MKVFAMIEPGYMGNIWGRTIVEGIHTECVKKRYELITIVREQLEQENAMECFTEAKPLLIMVGTSLVWIEEMLQLTDKLRIHAILVNNVPVKTSGNLSGIHNNHELATKTLMEYLVKNGRGRLALFGINRNSQADVIKEHVVRQLLPEAGVYYSNGSIEECSRSFDMDAERYDGIICANDIVAVYLVKRLLAKGAQIPEDYAVVSYGGTMLAEMIKPSLTTVRLDYDEMGRQAVLLYASLQRNADNISSVTSIVCDIIERESTRGMTKKEDIVLRSIYQSPEHNIDFIADPDIKNIMDMEAALAECSDSDIQIMQGIIGGQRISELSEKLFLSESTMKYRIKQLLQRFGCSSKREMIEKMGAYFPKA